MAEEHVLAKQELDAATAAATGAFDEIQARIGQSFHRREMRQRVRRYLVGLLGQVKRKSSWQLAEALGESGPQGVQRLFTDAGWDADAVRDAP